MVEPLRTTFKLLNTSKPFLFESNASINNAVFPGGTSYKLMDGELPLANVSDSNPNSSMYYTFENISTNKRYRVKLLSWHQPRSTFFQKKAGKIEIQLVKDDVEDDTEDDFNYTNFIKYVDFMQTIQKAFEKFELNGDLNLLDTPVGKDIKGLYQIIQMSVNSYISMMNTIVIEIMKTDKYKELKAKFPGNTDDNDQQKVGELANLPNSVSSCYEAENVASFFKGLMEYHHKTYNNNEFYIPETFKFHLQCIRDNTFNNLYNIKYSMLVIKNISGS